MDERGNVSDSLTLRIEQLERERDELRKDIEQLCLQQAGPSYLAVATRMHFQRTAGLEQEIESLKKKLASCARDNQNLQEELSEAYRIKSQLADLHSAEVLKNMEAEKQVKFFQGCVAAAFSERDHSLMESEKTMEREEAITQKLFDCQNRVEELLSACHDEEKLNASLQMEVSKLKEQTESFAKVISKFYEVRQRTSGSSECKSWEEKCLCLLDDPSDMWIFDKDKKTSSSKYNAPLEDELERMRTSMDHLHNKMRMGLEIEQHLKRKVQQLGEKQFTSISMISEGLSTLRSLCSQQRSEIMNILEEEKTQIKSNVIELLEKIKQLCMNRELNFGDSQRDSKCDETECRDVHITSDISLMAKKNGVHTSTVVSVGTSDTSNALAQALQEKVAALLLLSQQEERHLLERDVHVALQKKMEELQRSLIQVTNEKVKVLMELAQLKQEFQLLQENCSHGMRPGKVMADAGVKNNTAQDRDRKLKNILKKTYLGRWMSNDLCENETEYQLNTDESSAAVKKGSYSMDLARLKVENATLQESIANIEHLTSSIRKLRLSLLKKPAIYLFSICQISGFINGQCRIEMEIKARGAASAGPVGNPTKELDDIIVEASHLKMAVGSSIPVSWSAEATDAAEPSDGNIDEDSTTAHMEVVSSDEKLDHPVSAAGFEMVELLILAAEFQKEKVIAGNSESGELIA